MLIWGTRSKAALVGFVTSGCVRCRAPRVFAVFERAKKFSLYFVPLVTYSRKSVAMCVACGLEGRIEEGARVFPDERSAHDALRLLVAEEPEAAPPRPARTTGAPEAVLSAEPSRGTVNRHTKICPDCAEPVLVEARICRFCRHEFAAASEHASPASNPSVPAQRDGVTSALSGSLETWLRDAGRCPWCAAPAPGAACPRCGKRKA